MKKKVIVSIIIGVFLILFIGFGLLLFFAGVFILFAFEWDHSTIEKTDILEIEQYIGEDYILDEEIIPLTEKELKPPPPPPPPPPKITIVEDDIVIEEELEIEDADTDEDEIIEILEEEEELFNLAVVEQQPIFPGCSETAPKDQNYICFQRGIGTHIKNNFKYPTIAKEMGISEKIFIEFVIDKTGTVKSARVVRGKDKHLKQEALRLVNSIPIMTPARQRGKPVAVTFTLPINFSLQ